VSLWGDDLGEGKMGVKGGKRSQEVKKGLKRVAHGSIQTIGGEVKRNKTW